MGNKKKKQMEFRYYEIPYGEPVLALLGEQWNQSYGFDRNQKLVTDLHFHNLMEIGCCYEGTGELVLEEKKYPFCGGMISVIPGKFPHTTLSPGGEVSRWEFLFLDVQKIVEELYGQDRRLSEWILSRCSRGAFCKSREEAPELYRLVVMILQEMDEKKERYQEAVRGLLGALLVEISRNSKENSAGEENGLRETAGRQHLSRAFEYVSLHYMHEIRAEDLAEACHVSESHLRRLFAQSMGMSPMDYVNCIRIERACQRMKQTEESIAATAAQSGFVSVSTFNRNFRRVLGVTPREWKKSPENYQGRLAQYRIEYYDGWE